MKKLKMTKREAAITFLELCHGYLVLFAIYACAVVTSGHGNEPFIQVGLLLFPVNAILFAAVRWAGHFWQYGLIAALAVVGSVMAAGSGVRGIWMGILGSSGCYFLFLCQSGQKHLLAGSAGISVDRDRCDFVFSWRSFCIRYGSTDRTDTGGCIFSDLQFHTNLEEVDTFLKNHATMERLPVRRLARINQGMMWIVSGLTAAAMIVAPYLGLDQLIRQLGNALKTVIRWLLLLIPNSPVEEETMATEQAQQAMPAVGNQAPWFLELFYKLLDLIGWMIGIGLVLACVFLVIRALYRLYLRFNEKTEENGDTIERLMPAPAAEKKKGLEHKKKEHLFWDRSTDGRIRKHYRKKVLEKLKESPDEAWTPTQTAREMELEPGEAETFARIYEKARYGKDDCSREEMEKMLKIR